MATIKTMNNISKKGLGLFGPFYQVSDAIENPDAILVRSAQVDTDNFNGLLAVARAGAGVNNITIDKASAKGICVFNTPGANANAVAELVMTVLGMAVRNADKAAAWVKGLDVNDPDLAKTVESGKKKFAGMELAGKTLGVVGLGKIGVLVANYARWKNMRVIAYEPYPNANNMHELSNKVEIADLDTVIANSDFLTVHVPFIKGVTENLLNRKNLAQFKGSYIMNFARGGILKDYIEYGCVRNSVNFPALVDHPHAGIKSRVVVINQDVPNMISEITKVFGAEGINIASFSNKSNGKIGYNLVDVESKVDDSIVEKLSKLDKVIKVRVIHF